MAKLATAGQGATGLVTSITAEKVQARKVVLVSIFLLAAIGIYRDRSSETPAGTFRRLWGVGVVGMMLSLAADFVPQLAGPFAGLIVLGSLTHGGDKLIESALGAISKAPGSGAASPASTSSSSPPGPGSSSSSTHPPATK